MLCPFRLIDLQASDCATAARRCGVAVQPAGVAFALGALGCGAGPPIRVEEVVPGKAFLLHGVLSRRECAHVVRATDRWPAAQGGYSSVGEQGYSQSVRDCERIVCTGGALNREVWRRVKPVLCRLGLSEHTVPAKAGFNARGRWVASGLNERWRFVRYFGGGHFAPHCDQSYQPSSERRSFLTFNLYLNTVPASAGGSTEFLLGDAAQELWTASDWLAFGAQKRRHIRRTAAQGAALAAADAGAAEEADTLDCCAAKSGYQYDPQRGLEVQPEAGAALVFWQPELLHCGHRLLGTAACGGPAGPRGLKYLARSDVMFTRAAQDRPQLTAAQQEAVAALRAAAVREAEKDFRGAAKLYDRAHRLWPFLETSEGQRAADGNYALT